MEIHIHTCPIKVVCLRRDLKAVVILLRVPVRTYLDVCWHHFVRAARNLRTCLFVAMFLDFSQISDTALFRRIRCIGFKSRVVLVVVLRVDGQKGRLYKLRLCVHGARRGLLSHRRKYQLQALDLDIAYPI